MNQDSRQAPEAPHGKWLNRNVVGMAATSLLSDLGHETATAVLPTFLALLGVPPVGLGAIEGIADATSSFVKLGTGWFSDKLGHRKAVTVAGYALTGVSQTIFAVATGFPLVLAGRTIGWFARGVRAPLRNAMLAGSVSASDRGKAFGFHRAADTVGAVLGPVAAIFLLQHFAGHSGADPLAPYRLIFLCTAVPGLASAIVLAVTVTDRGPAKNASLRFWATLRSLPRGLRRAMGAVGIYGLGDFSHTLMILAGVELLRPGLGTARATAITALLYVLHNVTYALTPYPVGALSDRLGRRWLLAVGYGLGAAVSIGFGLCLARQVASVPVLAVLFAAGGITLGFVDTLEGALLADLTPVDIRGTAYGALGSINGVGDLVSSLVVGALWTIHPLWGFGYAAVMMLAGAGSIVLILGRRTRLAG